MSRARLLRYSADASCSRQVSTGTKLKSKKVKSKEREQLEKELVRLTEKRTTARDKCNSEAVKPIRKRILKLIDQVRLLTKALSDSESDTVRVAAVPLEQAADRFLPRNSQQSAFRQVCKSSYRYLPAVHGRNY